MNRKEYEKLRKIVQKTYKSLYKVGKITTVSKSIGLKTTILQDPKDIEALVINVGKLLIYLNDLDKKQKLVEK